MSALEESARTALQAWGLPGDAGAPLGNGLINRTFLVERAGGRLVLQHVNTIFTPRIHENIQAVTNALTRAGMKSLELVPTLDGKLYAESDGVWRVYRHIAGVSVDVATSGPQVRSAGRLVGAFHAALNDLSHEFIGQRLGVHDTERHLATLREALAEHDGHRLIAEVRALADALLEAASRLPDLPAVSLRVGHGDLKLGNVLFECSAPSTALCLVDLDTVGPIKLAHELGDMWRSWCNRSTEDDDEASLDLDVMRESWAGYRAGFGRAALADERDAALLGVEWISLELASRFAADALRESYFGWNPAKFRARGEHNLKRARGQWSLHRAFRATRDERRAIISLER